VKRSFNILHVTSSRRLTGAAGPLLGQAREMAARGHNVSVACAHGCKLAGIAHEAGLPTFKLHLPRGAWLQQYIADYRALRRIVRENNIDIVHCHQSHDHWIVGMALGNSAVKVVAHNHLAHPLRCDALHRWLYSHMDGIVEVCGTAREMDAAQLPLANERVFHLPGFVDCDEFQPGQDSTTVRDRLGIDRDAIVIGSFARLDPDRLHSVLIEASAHIKRNDIRLLFSGSGEHRDKLLRQAQQAGIADRLVVASRSEYTFKEIRAVPDVLVHLAQGSDGSVRTVLEGFALGLPVIGARVGVIGDYIIDGETGLLIDKPLADLLAAALQELIENPEKRENLGRAARLCAESDYSLSTMGDRLEKIYSAVFQM
jgi:glycosyltransferase involved in cell wall biosynthesis